MCVVVAVLLVVFLVFFFRVSVVFLFRVFTAKIIIFVVCRVRLAASL